MSKKNVASSSFGVLPLAAAMIWGVLPAAPLPLSVPYDVPGVTYSETVPSPQHVIGHRIGDRHTRPDQVEAYLEAVARASDRVEVGSHGQTYENRPLVHAIVTSPANHRHLEELRRANLRLTTSPEAVSDDVLEEMPAVLWLGYSVHGNEASGTEASLLMLYHLAAGQGQAVDEILERTVVLLVPMLNPDGRDRFVDWANGNRARAFTSDPQNREHNEPWPGGRTNHFWFDLNRDWLPAQLIESRGRLELYHQWKPQLLTDHHEMQSTATFFFQPGVPSRDNPNTPEETIRLTGEIAKFHARRLDEIGSLYYSQESYDDFYYGKGSTYPDINGAVGILFEQASSRALLRDVGERQLSYGFTIRNQFVTSLSTLEAALHLRTELLRNQRNFYREALIEAEAAPLQGWILEGGRNGGRTYPFLQTLRRHGIDMHRLTSPVTIGQKRFGTEEVFVIPARQRQWRLLKSLMEKTTEYGDSVFYDVSTWTLPLAFAVEVTEIPDGVDLSIDSPALEVRPPDPPVPPQARYAYLMPWDQQKAPAALYFLQQAGLNCRVLTRPGRGRADGRDLQLRRGTIVIPVEQPAAEDSSHALVRQAAQLFGVEFLATDTGLTADGPDLGGPSAPLLTRPKIAILVGSGVRSSQAGEAWFALGERMEIPATLLDTSQLARSDLGRYTVLVFPEGNLPTSSSLVGKVRDWVHQGGTLIVLKGAVRWAVEQGLVEEKLRERSATRPDVPYADVRRAIDAATIPGSIFAVDVDSTHPVAFGLGSQLTVFREHRDILEVSETPGANVARYLENPLVSGYVPDGAEQEVSRSAAVVARKIGSGAVILFVDNPNFRAFWYGTEVLFMNAVFFGGIL